MSYHSPLSPSSFKANALCAGRYNFSKDMDDVSRIEAKQGTTAHELLQGWLERDMAWDVGEQFTGTNGVSIDAENIQHVRETYLWLVEFLKDKPGAVLYSEIRVDPGYTYNGTATSSGTSDIIIYWRGILYVFDYKNGMIDVNVLENYQLLLYALGAIRKFAHFDIKQVVVGVLQPRTFHHDGPYRLWEVDYSELMHSWDVKFRELVPIMMEGKLRTPGVEQCRWCKGHATCKEAAQQALAEAKAAFKDVSTATPAEVKAHVLRHPEELDDVQLRGIMESYEFIRGWLKAVKEHVEHRFALQDPLPGFKMVAGRGSRSWPTDDEEAMEQKIHALTDLDIEQFYKSKFKSPAQFENTVKSQVTKEEWEKIAALIKKTAGKATVVLESDARPAVNLTAKEAFKGVSSNQNNTTMAFLD